MNTLDQFGNSIDKHTNKNKQDIMFLIKDMFLLGMDEFSKTLWTMFASPMQGKNQIPLALEKWEEALIEQRKQ